MSRTLAIAAALWKIGTAETLAYRASLIVWIVSTTFPLISLVLWRALAESGPIGGWAQEDFDSYFVAAFLVRQLTAAWVVWDLDRQIRGGDLSTLLLRPVSPILHHVMVNLSTQPLRLLLAAPIGVAVLVATGSFELVDDPWIWPLIPIAIALGWLLAFTIQLAVACLAFWLTKAATLYEIYLGAFIVLSGYAVPTSLFPPGLAEVTRLLPFHAVLGFPVELVIGRLSLADALAGLGLQLAWLALAGVLASVLWRRGLRAYGAFGA
ncbi:ABC transporter permease [Nannocystaceae bacterium ST9]